MTRARVVWFEAPGVARVRDEELGARGPDEVAIRGIMSGVSAGTERIVLGGRVPPDVRAAMALPTMRGTFELPAAYGYALVGDALEPAGGRVFALHPHASYAHAPSSCVRRLPPSVPPARATLAANLETAVNVVWDAALGLGDAVVVLGLGVVGALVALLASRAGARVVGVDPAEPRRAGAERLGVDARAGADATLLTAADVIIEASGAPDALTAAVAGAGLDARVVVASWYGAAPVALPLGAAFHPNRVTIQSSQVGRLPIHRRARWDAARRFRLVCDLLEDPTLDGLVAPPVPLTDAPALYAELAAGVPWWPPHRVLDLSR